MEKLKMQTANKADENFKKLAEMFPNAVTEAKDENGNTVRAIDKDVLMQEINTTVVEGREERYQFTWPDKKKSILLANAPINKTLRPCREESVDFDNTENLYIEGDNLEVLKLLQETYLGKIKMIYIDPPYNTGNDFVYNDEFGMRNEEWDEVSGNYDEDGNQIVGKLEKNTEANGRFHTDWLNMIYPRLKIARDLLTDDGVILINMDENEITNLQNICREIFGKQNDLGTIVWDKRNPKGDAHGISCQHEYILVFAKNKSYFLSNNNVIRPKKNASEILYKARQLFRDISCDYTLEDVNKDFAMWIKSQNHFSGGERAYNKIDENGEPYQAVSMCWPNKKTAPDDYFVPLIHPVTKKPCPVPERGWRYPSKTMSKMLEEGKILFGKDEKTQPRSKYLLKENMYENIPSMLYYGGSDTAFLEKINIPFDTPKVADICKEHILSFTKEDDIILDFFSGSATTAHAVMLANEADKSKRKFIAVQIPEKCDKKTALYKKGFKTIAEAGRQRLLKCSEIIQDNRKWSISTTKHEWDQTVYYMEHQKECDKLGKLPESYFKENYPEIDTGFRVLKLDTSNMKDVYYSPADYEQSLFSKLEDNIKEGRTSEDLLFQVMLDLGILLSSKIQIRNEKLGMRNYTYYDVADGYLIACFDENVSDETIKAIAKQKPYYFVMRDSSMASDSVATNFEQIFATYSPDTVRKVL